MADTLSKKDRSRRMAAITASGNKSTELKLIVIFRAHGVTGWRRHHPLPGKPDFVFKKEKLAIFVDGCFWHGCRWHCRMPKSRNDFWAPKILRNKVRDGAVNRILRRKGWRVFRLWEHTLKNPMIVANKIQAVLAYPTLRR